MPQMRLSYAIALPLVLGLIWWDLTKQKRIAPALQDARNSPANQAKDISDYQELEESADSGSDTWVRVVMGVFVGLVAGAATAIAVAIAFVVAVLGAIGAVITALFEVCTGS